MPDTAFVAFASIPTHLLTEFLGVCMSGEASIMFNYSYFAPAHLVNHYPNKFQYRESESSQIRVISVRWTNDSGMQTQSGALNDMNLWKACRRTVGIVVQKPYHPLRCSLHTHVHRLSSYPLRNPPSTAPMKETPGLPQLQPSRHYRSFQ